MSKKPRGRDAARGTSPPSRVTPLQSSPSASYRAAICSVHRAIASIAELGPGDIIQHVDGGDVLIVHANYGEYAFAVRHQHVSNPIEWRLILKAGHEPMKDNA